MTTVIIPQGEAPVTLPEHRFPVSVDISEKRRINPALFPVRQRNRDLLEGGGSMTKERIEKAIEEATEFIARAKVVVGSGSYVEDMWWPPKTESGALRRQSMELTRALVEMRKPG